MDPLGIATSVISTALAIEAWIDQRRRKDASLVELWHTVSRLAVILAPLQPKPSAATSTSTSAVSTTSTWDKVDDPAITTCLQDMRELLQRVQDDLVLWEEKRTRPAAALLEFLRPSAVLARIEEHDRRLARRADTLAFALQVYFLRRAYRDTGRPETETEKEKEPLPPPSALDEVQNAEVKQFWEERVGQEMSFIDGPGLCRELGTWLGAALDRTTCDTLLLRLDEYAVGGVAPGSLDGFVGQRSIRSAIAGLGVLGGLAASRQFEPIDVSKVKPVLVWIDDRPENNVEFVAEAERLGITVIILTSTAAAKVWIEANEELLRRTDFARRLRFISDNCRWEAADGIGSPGMPVVENLTAGEAMLRYLRGRQYRAPVLICCGYSIRETQYVLSFSRAGSTVYTVVAMEYISALGRGDDEDRCWEGFDVSFV
ncbi:hypothetical protein EVG20_g7040 [Dentipellis fragilis]|uniref:Uncharacterized protein n=1 Tax=Dentipellis fragilis TaxID=205917 RepID=A0A4Y9YJ50_9AGAM|nr:hypothetical protein EVG20_g7040 [Dentipellis fragilis]